MVVNTVPVMRGRRRLGIAYSWGRSGRMKAFANLYKRKATRNNKEEILREKKKMRMWRMNRCSSNGDNISNNPSRGGRGLFDDGKVMCEVLSRLPVKSLMRFKSVCKRWLSLIQHDPYFHDLHLMQSKTRPCLFIIISILEYRVYDFIISGYREFLLSVNFLQGRADVYTSRKAKSMDYFGGILKPVNGLICSVDSVQLDSVRIYNPSTREATPWIKNRIKERKEEELQQGGEVDNQLYFRYFPLYEFGFDPATKEHKVICVCQIISPRDLTDWSVACEILTLGDNSWRSIDEVPPYNLYQRSSVYANGSIYWCKKKDVERDEGDDDKVIVAFDVGSEKFRVITVPNFIVIDDSLEMDGHLALVGRKDAYTVEMWIYDDDYGNKEKISRTTTNSASNGNWTEVTIKLPFHWNKRVRLSFHAFAGTDQIILHYHKDPASLYSYSWKMKTFKKFEISGVSSSIPGLASPRLFTPFVESLSPVLK